MDLRRAREVAESQGRPLDDGQLDGIRDFLDELYRRNEVSNLTRVAREDADLRHVSDSLLISEYVGEGVNVLDIGPGPGFPSWILACCRPDVKVTAVESQGKMGRMLTALPLPNLNLMEQRAEENVQREAFDVVTGRAVAPFAVQAEISAAWLKVEGLFVPFRTPIEWDEIEQFPAGMLGLQLEAMEERDLPESEVVRLFPIFRKVRPTPIEFPRSWGRIKTRPLTSGSARGN